MLKINIAVINAIIISEKRNLLSSIGNKKFSSYWIEQFDLVENGLDTWDFVWAYSVITQNMISVVPKYNLISNIHAADTIIFKKSNLYWLLTTTSNNNDYSSQLNIFYSDNPLSQSWKAHKNNPVKYDINNGRNGGLIIKNNGELIICRDSLVFHLQKINCK